MNKVLRLTIPLGIALIMLGAGLLLVDASAASGAGVQGSLLVTTLDDELNDDGDCSLREAIQAATTNAAVDACGSGDAGEDTITFAVAGTITLTEQLSVQAGGPLLIDGAAAVTLSGGGSVRIFYIGEDADLGLQGLTLANGYESIIGGAIYNTGTLTIVDSTLSGNTAPLGGGIRNSGSLTLTNSTLSGNHADIGGGINNNGTLNITNRTFSGNFAQEEGGGIYNSGTLTIANSIVANSTYGGDCSASFPITDGGHNLSSDDSCGFDTANGSLPDTDPLLGPLQDNGGPTWTHALLEGSPAIDAGDDTQCPATDQRGVYRPLDGDKDGLAVCDIGSFEFFFPINYLPLIVKD